MATQRVYFCIYSDERYGHHRKLEKVTMPIPAGAEVYEYNQPEVQYVEDEVAYMMPETYKAVDINGERWRVNDAGEAYKFVPVMHKVTMVDDRDRLCFYDIPTNTWHRYIHQVTHYTEEEFKKMVARPDGVDDYDMPPSWTPEEWNSCSEACRLLMEVPVQDAVWAHVTDSRDPATIGDNPVC